MMWRSSQTRRAVEGTAGSAWPANGGDGDVQFRKREAAEAGMRMEESERGGQGVRGVSRASRGKRQAGAGGERARAGRPRAQSFWQRRKMTGGRWWVGLDSYSAGPVGGRQVSFLSLSNISLFLFSVTCF